MPASTVRAAVASWISGGNIAGLNTVYRAQPWFVDGQKWNLSAQLGSGAVGFVHILEEAERRLTFPAESPANTSGVVGEKEITYTLGFVVLYQYLIPTDPASEDDWVDPLDTLLAAIKARLRSDPTLGTGGDPIFEAAQDPNDCRTVHDLPRRDSGTVQSWNVVEFHATEIIQA